MTSRFINIADLMFEIGDWLNDKNPSTHQISGLLGSYKYLFVADRLENFSVNSRFFCFIRTHTRSPIFLKSNLTCVQNQILGQKINELMNAGYIQPSTSQWSAPVYVDFIDGEIRILMDYSAISSFTIANDYYVPSKQQVISSMASQTRSATPTLFTRIIIKDAYHQMMIETCSRHKTAFATDFGHFEWTVMDHSMKNSEQFLQKTMEEILRDVDQSSIAIYLDQVLILTDTYDAHLLVLKDVLKCFKIYNLKIDPRFSCFLVKEVNFLGSVISANGVQFDAEILNRILNFPVPISKADVRYFLNSISEFAPFIQGFDFLAAPLIKLAGSSFKFYWDFVEQDSFTSLKTAFAATVPKNLI